MLVADLVEEAARDFLEECARENEEAWVPLVSAPVGMSPHVLEIYTPSSTEPLRVLAEPTGPPGEHGFPLRLSVLSEEAAVSFRASHGTGRMVEEVAVAFDLTIEPAQESVRSSSEGSPSPPSAGARDALLGRSLAGGKLQIESLIGKGMMGAVYKATHRELRIPVAVKVMHERFQHDEDFCRRFYDEALAASRLDHPNLVRVYDFGQEPDGLLYLSMEFIAGRDLRAALAEEGPMPVTRIAELMMQVCGGLGHAHARGIVHRDVKPDNVVLVMRLDDDGRPREQVKVCDFGLALLRASDSTNERFAGTPVYMSPEQCRGEELDARTDVYSCGIMLFELATGTVPFLSDKPIIVVNRHLSAPPPLMASVHAEVDRRLEPIVQKALMKSRDDRYDGARALRADLKALLAPPTFDLAREVASRAPEVSPDVPPVSVRARVPSMPPPSAPMPPAAASMLPSPPSVAPPSKRTEQPAWFEDKQDSYANFLGDMASGEKRAKEVSVSLARDPKKWLTQLLEERDARLFDKMLGEVEPAARLLAQKADAKALRALSSTIHGIATDVKRPAVIRASALTVMKVFADPALLAPVAEKLLQRGEDSEAASALVLDAGPAGAYALYGARVKLAADAAVREPFVATMRALGESSWPVVRAALERIPATALTGEHPRAAELAEDLLWSVPVMRDDAAGALVAKYVRTTQASLCRAATQALGRLWAERAAPLLLALLDVLDDGVRIAAIAGLRQIGAVDEHVVRHLVPILTRTVQAGDELRLAAVTALEFVTPDARPVAVPILVKLVRDPGWDDATILAASRALLSVMGNEARAVIIDRSDTVPEPLKSHLLVLLRDPKLPEVDAKTIRALG